MKTEETNKLIAEFLGWSKKINKEEEEIPFYNLPIKFRNPNGIKEYIPIEGFIFESDWNWLMQVVGKIKPLVSESEFNYRIGKHLLNLNIEAVYNACVAFIKWYNEKILEVIANKTKNDFGNLK